MRSISCKTLFRNFLTLTPLTLSLTGDGPSRAEGHTLHSFGEYDLVNGTYGRGKEGRRRVNNEGRTEQKVRKTDKSEEDGQVRNEGELWLASKLP